MYEVKYKLVAEAIESDSRHFRAVLEFSGFTIEGAQVGSIKPSFGSTQNDTPCVGDVVSTQAEIQITEMPDSVVLEGKEFQLYLYVMDLTDEAPTSETVTNSIKVWADYTLDELKAYTIEELCTTTTPSIRKELIPWCKLTVLKVVDNIDYYTLTCSDRLHFADKPYESKLTYPASSIRVIWEIGRMIGTSVEIEPAQNYIVSSNGNYIVSSNDKRFITSTWQFTIMQKPVGYTMRQMLGYIAAMRGKFIVIDRTGKLVQRWYTDGDTKYLDLSTNANPYYIDSAEINAYPIEIAGMICTVDDNTTFEVGDTTGRTMEFECPYMTQDRLSEVFTITKLQYYPATFTQRLGDPRWDLWDKFAYKNSHLLLLNMNYTFDGGLMMDVDSGGNTDTETEANGRY